MPGMNHLLQWPIFLQFSFPVVKNLHWHGMHNIAKNCQISRIMKIPRDFRLFPGILASGIVKKMEEPSFNESLIFIFRKLTIRRIT